MSPRTLWLNCAQALVTLCVCAACSDSVKPPAAPSAPTTTPARAEQPTVPAPTQAPPFDQAFVIELKPEQSQETIRTMATAMFTSIASLESLFPDVDPADDPYGLSRIYRLRVDGAGPAATAWDNAYALAERGNFVRVEPDTDTTLVRANQREAALGCFADEGVPAPTDPSWSLRQMKVPEARALTPSSPGKALGEGVRICHPDSGWTHHIDLDQAQFDLASSINLIDGGTNALDPLGYRGNPGHGTATGSVLISSGGIGAQKGTEPPGIVTGLAPRATLVPIRAFKSVVQVLDSDIARAVRHSVTAHCDVISMSLGGGLFFGLERAVQDAVRKDVIVVAAAGNCVGFVVAPASYDEVIAVAATNADEKPWRGTSKGRAVDIAAPGEDVYVAEAETGSGDHVKVHTSDGTSFATAEIAGSAAVWIAYHGRDAIKNAQGARTRRDLFLQALRATARVPTGWDAQRFGAGIVNLHDLLMYDIRAAPTALVAPARNDTVSLLARMFDRDNAQVRAGLVKLLGNPVDFEGEISRFGPELLDVAAGDPDAFIAALDSFAHNDALTLHASASVQSLRAQSSRSLGVRLQPSR